MSVCIAPQNHPSCCNDLHKRKDHHQLSLTKLPWQLKIPAKPDFKLCTSLLAGLAGRVDKDRDCEKGRADAAIEIVAVGGC
jgi:hypothetical protein